MIASFAPSRELARRRLEHGGPRIYDPRERLALGLFDAGLRAASRLLGLRPPKRPPPPGEARRILAVRLDRLGDLLTTLPALQALRAAAPRAHIELAVGRWNEPVARRLPFADAVRVVDAPWAAWGDDASFASARRALAEGDPVDVAIEFQGDVRAILLAALTRAPVRAGYAETGGGYLLTHRGPWDESKSWYWQNLSLVRTLFPEAPEHVRPYNFLQEEDRKRGAAILASRGLEARRPLVGIQPSAGRAIKEWGDENVAALADALGERATVMLTGAEGDRPRIARIHARTKRKPETIVGATLLELAAIVERLDVLVSGDTGPMHLSHAVGTPNVAIFGPSDPVRYGPVEGTVRRRVVRRPVYCSPCNMIRRPPRECLVPPHPECLAGIPVADVHAAVLEELSRAGSKS